MKSYREIDENSNEAILKKARIAYAKKVGKFGQLELAEYLGVSASYVGHWEQGETEIPEKYFTKINNLLGTNLKTNIRTYNNDLIRFQAPLYFYFGLYKFTQRQYEYIMAKILMNFCKDILNNKEITKYNKLINAVKKNYIFTEVSYKNYKECYSHITSFLNSFYKNTKQESNRKLYFSEMSNKFLTQKEVLYEVYNLLHSLDSKEIIYEHYQNIPVYNSSGVIVFYEHLPQKFNDNKYEYVYYLIDNVENKFPNKYVTGALALIRLGEFCFPREDIIVKIRNSINIEHISTEADMKLLKKDFEQWLIDDYKIIGAVVMIDYSPYSNSAIQDKDFKITF